LDKVRQVVLDIVRGFSNIEEARLDSAGNIYVRKSAHPSCVSAPGVILQGVCGGFRVYLGVYF